MLVKYGYCKAWTLVNNISLFILSYVTLFREKEMSFFLAMPRNFIFFTIDLQQPSRTAAFMETEEAFDLSLKTQQTSGFI